MASTCLLLGSMGPYLEKANNSIVMLLSLTWSAISLTRSVEARLIPMSNQLFTILIPSRQAVGICTSTMTNASKQVEITPGSAVILLPLASVVGEQNRPVHSGVEQGQNVKKYM